MATTPFQHRYGPWAVVAGASEGLGAAFAESLASRGINLVLVARRAEPLAACAEQLRSRYGVDVIDQPLDLSDLSATVAFARNLSQDIGLLVYNAAYSAVGYFAEVDLADLQKILAVNTQAPLTLVRELAPGLLTRGRGGVVLMSSLSGNQGSANIATYAASKSFNTVLAEGLWQEFGERGVDVVASCAGAIRTPGYQSAESGAEAPGIMDPADVAEETLDALGKSPVVVPGRTNTLAQFLMRRMLPRKTAIRLMSKNTRGLSG